MPCSTAFFRRKASSAVSSSISDLTVRDALLLTLLLVFSTAIAGVIVITRPKLLARAVNKADLAKCLRGQIVHIYRAQELFDSAVIQVGG